MMLGACALNWWAAVYLGRAYDRLVPPDSLVTTGPYRYLQHPIYVSYVLLFCGYCLVSGSPPFALAMLACCSVYYGHRTGIERKMLHKAFSGTYESWARRTARYVPGVV